MNLKGFEKIESGKGLALKSRSSKLNITSKGWIMIGKEIVKNYNLTNKEKADIYVKQTNNFSFEIAFIFSNTGEYNLHKGNSVFLSCKILKSKYPNIIGFYDIIGAENKPTKTIILCKKEEKEENLEDK